MAKTNDTKSMLIEIINSLTAFKLEVFKRFDGVEKKFLGIEGRFDSLEKKLTERLDKIGRQLAYLEDDAPTRQEFDGLEKRVDKLERKPSSAVS